MRPWDATALDRAGLNLQAVFDLDALPAEVTADLRRQFDPAHDYRQLILVGHAGKTLWSAVKAAGIASADPIDDFSVAAVERWFAAECPGRRRRVVYPGEGVVGLQTLGRLAGWHHVSPFMVGINERWGTWYAYRVALLADSDLEPTPALAGASPCERCAERPCIPACPAGALGGDGFRLDRCIAYRGQPDSRCRDTCLARLGCPVGAEHRYCDEQIRHSYSISMRMIEPRRRPPGTQSP